MCLANSFARMESLCLFNSVIGNHVREQHGNEPCEIAKNFRVLRKCSNKFDCLIFEMFLIRDLKPKLNKQSDSIRAKLFAKHIVFFFYSFHLLLYFIFAFPYSYCLYANTCFLLFIPLFQKLYICGIILSMNLNLKMTVERSKRRSYFLLLVFITKSLIYNHILFFWW